MPTQVEKLQFLLSSLSDGVWEHGQGIVIENLDNPGWSIRLALSGTRFATLAVKARFEDRSDTDWIHVQTIERDKVIFLEVNCGPSNLVEALDVVFENLT